jgi:membrane protease YdiL (CAAX protease family)
VLNYIRNLVLNTFHTAEEESSEYIRLHGKQGNSKLMIICVITAFGLTVIHYFGDVAFFSGFLKGIGANGLSSRFDTCMYNSAHAQLYRLSWWVGTIILFYLVVPVLLIKFYFKEALSDYGVRFRGAFKDIRLYIVMLCVMIPLVLICSSTKSFQARYPFYDLQPGEPYFPHFIIWEVLYFLQFFSLEFFFRGFMVHGLKNRFGFYSVFVMTIPYCMIHFGKPMPETLSAIIAGIVLGILSLKSRSILLGVLIHYSVAITMDLCALWHKGLL